MYVDPVVQEVRRRGAEIAEACRGDIHCMAEYFRQKQTENQRRIVRREARPGEAQKTDLNR